MVVFLLALGVIALIFGARAAGLVLIIPLAFILFIIGGFVVVELTADLDWSIIKELLTGAFHIAIIVTVGVTAYNEWKKQ